MSPSHIAALGAIAGLTIFIGLPVGRLRAGLQSTRTVLNAVAIGVLVFLLWDILAHGWEPVDAALSVGDTAAAIGYGVILVGGLGVGLVGLVWFDQWVARRTARLSAASGAATSATTTSATATSATATSGAATSATATAATGTEPASTPAGWRGLWAPATTHWALADRFRELFPKVRLDPDVLFVDDGDILTSAGAASGVDLCLHVLRNDHGAAVANHAARLAVVPPWRDGGQAQYIEQPVPAAGATGTAATREWALARLHRPLTLAELAGHAAMSSRTFARRFHDETGQSPGRWLTQQRVALARHLLEATDLTVDQIAGRVGFANAVSLRQHLHSAIGVSPLAYRRTFAGA